MWEKKTPSIKHMMRYLAIGSCLLLSQFSYGESPKITQEQRVPEATEQCFCHSNQSVNGKNQDKSQIDSRAINFDPAIAF